MDLCTAGEQGHLHAQEGSCHQWKVNIPNKDTLREDNVRTIFRQAEFPAEEIERFFDAATPV